MVDYGMNTITVTDLDPESGALTTKRLRDEEWITAHVRNLSDDVLIKSFLATMDLEGASTVTDALVAEIWYRPSLSGDEALSREDDLPIDPAMRAAWKEAMAL